MSELTPTQPNIDALLAEFATHADDWFKEHLFVQEFHQFVQEFFKPENLQKAEWPQFKELANHLHSLNSVALAKANAFGRMNYPLEKYRESFHFLAHGEGSAEARMRAFMGDKEAYASKYLGSSAVSELIGQLFADQFVFMNRRDLEAAEFLGLHPVYAPGADFPAKFTAFNTALQPLFKSYEEIVGSRLSAPIGLNVDQFLSWLYESKIPKKPLIDKGPPLEGPQVWIIAPGPKARFWGECRAQAIAVYGADLLGSLEAFATKEEILQQLKIRYSKETEPTNDALAAWEFCRVMKEGDLLIAKKGNRKIVGVGIVRGGYRYDPSRKEYPNVRDVEWTHDGEWLLPDGDSFAQKTLTNITRSKDFVAKVWAATGIQPDLESAPSYFWLNCPPDDLRVSTYAIGEEQTYATHNENGNKRTVYACFQTVKPGDKIIGYETTPVQKVTSVLEVTHGLHEPDGGNECISFKVVEQLAEPRSLQDLRKQPALANCGPLLGNHLGNLFQITKADYEAILAKGPLRLVDLPDEPELEEFSIKEALEKVFVGEADFRGWLKQWALGKNLILQGPPGVGKTFVARTLAYALMQVKDPRRVAMVQFHQSYGYEEFVQGYRPGTKNFELRNGTFYDFCIKAKESPKDQPFVFVIDEINRGNMSRIFGELLMLTEPDKRGEGHALRLAYQGEGQSFFVPENVYLLGLMNTADRSLAVVDYALRRRFRFATLQPAFNSTAFREHLADSCDDDLAQQIILRVGRLNEAIAKDVANLGPGFCIGHSYFCQITSILDYREVIHYQIAPLLREYWFDAPKKAEDWIEDLLGL